MWKGYRLRVLKQCNAQFERIFDKFYHRDDNGN